MAAFENYKLVKLGDDISKKTMLYKVIKKIDKRVKSAFTGFFKDGDMFIDCEISPTEYFKIQFTNWEYENHFYTN